MSFLDVPTLRWGAALLLIVAGGGFALYGERNFHFVLGLVGLLIGVILGQLIASILEAGRYVRIAAMLAGGAAGIYLNIFMFYINLITVGSYTGMLLVMLVMNFLMDSWFETPVLLLEWGLLLLGGLIGAGLALAFRKLLIVIFSALHGSAAMIFGIGLLTHTEEIRRIVENEQLLLDQLPVLMGTLLWLILAVGASTVQYRYTGTISDGQQNVESYPKRERSHR